MLPTKCPSCNSFLRVRSLVCDNCQTEVTGKYNMPTLLYLSQEEQQFVLNFVKSSGSLKDMSSLLGLSYPTVRNMLNEIIDKIKFYEEQI